MNAVGFILRLYSYAYQLVLALFVFAVAMVLLTLGQHNVHVEAMPWKEGQEAVNGMLGLGLMGLVCTALAMLGRLRFVFPLWCLVVLVLMVRGLVLGGYHFSGDAEFNAALWLIAGAFGAFLSSLMLLRKNLGKR